MHSTGAAPAQVPARQLSVRVQALPSLHAAPEGFSGFEHAPDAGSHMPGTWHSVLRRTLNGFGAGARPCLARVRPRAGVAIVTERAIGQHGNVAGACQAVADITVVTLILDVAAHPARTDARARQAHVHQRAGILIVARCEVGLHRIRTDACRGIARSSEVALSDRRASDGIPLCQDE